VNETAYMPTCVRRNRLQPSLIRRVAPGRTILAAMPLGGDETEMAGWGVPTKVVKQTA